MARPQPILQTSTIGLTNDASAYAGTSSDILNEVLAPSVKLACWIRHFPADVTKAFDEWPDQMLPHFRTVTTVSGLASLGQHIVESRAKIPKLARDTLASDLVVLAKLFCRVTNAVQFEIRVESIADDSCWKFHQDNLPVRMLATYRGPGTQWGPASYADEALKDQKAYRGPLYELPRFAVAMAKGAARTTDGLIHRSPPIIGSSVVRLFVAINSPIHAHGEGCDCVVGSGLRYRKPFARET